MKSLSSLALAFTLLVFCPMTRGAEVAPSPTPSPTPYPSSYPLTTCIVSDDKLGEMGKPISIDYKGQQVSFCCKSCIGSFEKDPSKYLAKLPAPTKP
jgi:YHS domain-containing protein